MSISELEKRLSHLEAEFENLKHTIESSGSPSTGWKRILGTFAGDADHEAAMKLGREYRKSLRPKSTGRRRVSSRH